MIYTCTYSFQDIHLNLIATKQYLLNIHFTKLQKALLPTTELLSMTITQLDEYFQGRRKSFNVPLQFKGTEFQIKVWQELANIPYGDTCSYKDIAERINRPKAYRAVGMANNKNPFPIILPCHRVIGSQGQLTGYAGGLDIKNFLLQLERQYC